MAPPRPACCVYYNDERIRDAAFGREDAAVHIATNMGEASWRQSRQAASSGHIDKADVRMLYTSTTNDSTKKRSRVEMESTTSVDQGPPPKKKRVLRPQTEAPTKMKASELLKRFCTENVGFEGTYVKFNEEIRKVYPDDYKIIYEDKIARNCSRAMYVIHGAHFVPLVKKGMVSIVSLSPKNYKVCHVF